MTRTPRTAATRVPERWRALAEVLRSKFPELEVAPTAEGLRWRRAHGPFRLLGSAQLRRKGASPAKAGESYFDESTGALRLSASDVLIYLDTNVRASRLTPVECALATALIEVGAATATRLLAGPGVGLARWLSLAVDAEVPALTASRLRGALVKTGCYVPAREDGPRGANGRFDPVATYEQVGEDFRASAIGPARAFAVADFAAFRARLASLPPGSTLEGLSALVVEDGGFIDAPDFVVARDRFPEFERLVGPRSRRTDLRTPQVRVRSASRIPLRYLEGRDRPGKLQRILAAAALRRESGVLGRIGETLWRKLRPSA